MKTPAAPKNHARDLEAVLYNAVRTLSRVTKKLGMVEGYSALCELEKELDAALATLRSGAVSIYETQSTSSGPVPPGYVALGDRMWRGELLANGWLLKLFTDLQAARDAAPALNAAAALARFLAAVKDVTREKPVEGFQPAGKGKRRMYYRGQNAGMGRN